jgi:hypothetical protein
VDLTASSSGRSLTIDRARKARIRRDSVLQAIEAPRGRRQLAVTSAIAGALGLAGGGWPAAVLMFVIGVLGHIGWWWLRLGADLRSGLDVGQTIRLDYATSGEISLTDSTGQLWFGRGSVMTVLRFRGNAIVVGREMAFVLPRELLTEADIAFLEGHGPAPGEATALGPDLPLSCEITADIQRKLVAASTRVIARSADFLMPWFSALFVTGMVAYVGSAPAVAGAMAFGALIVLPGVRGILSTRRRMRLTYAVGMTVRADVTEERLLLSLKHSTRPMPLRDFSGIGVTTGVVLLRRARRVLAADRTVLVPIDLFDTAAMTTMSTVIGGRL